MYWCTDIFCIGTLVGDAVMHLIPHALEIHVHGANAAKYLDPAGKEKRTIIVCCVIILGMYMFFVLERMLQKYHHGHSHAHVCHGQVHETSCNETKVVEDKETEQQKLKPGNKPFVSNQFMLILMAI